MLKNYTINNDKTEFTPEEIVSKFIDKFKREGDSAFCDSEQYESMLRIRLIDQNVEELKLVIGGEAYILKHPKEKKKLTTTERIELLEQEVKELRELVNKLMVK